MKFYENSIVHNPKLELQNAETAKKVSVLKTVCYKE